MLGFGLQHSDGTSPPPVVLALGAHSDDVEIGAGGTLAALVAGGASVHLRVLSAVDERADEARASAADLLGPAAASVVLGDIPDGRFPAHWQRVKDALEACAGEVRPDLIFAPRRDDAHQDHRTVGSIVPTVFRSSLILHYEIPKWDGDLGRPNVYVPMQHPQLRRKVDLLRAHFASQRGRAWFDDETFFGLARLRGLECKTLYAEAFECAKATLYLDRQGSSPTASS